MQPRAGATGDRATAFLLLTLAAALCAAFPARAQDEDERLFQNIEVWAADNVTHDSNVLRLSKHIDPSSVGARKLSDTSNTMHFGVNADIPASLQRFQLAYDWFQTRYRQFSDFNFTGHVARGNWQWVVNPGFNGSLGYSDARSLSSFSNIQSRTADLVTTRQAWVTGNWMVTPRWRANGGYNSADNTHDNPARAINDIHTETGDVGLAYVTPLDNSIGLVARTERGHLPNTVIVTGVPFNNKYRQFGYGGAVTWNLGGHSRLDARAEYVRRDYEQFTQRNFNGLMARALYAWTPTAKLTLNASLYRDVGPAEDVVTSFVLMTGGYVRPRWTVTEKITLQANLEYDTWDYKGDPVAGQSFTHHVRMAGGSVAYAATRKILLQAGVNREVRTSTLAFADYEVTVAFLEGRIGF